MWLAIQAPHRAVALLSRISYVGFCGGMQERQPTIHRYFRRKQQGEEQETDKQEPTTKARENADHRRKRPLDLESIFENPQPKSKSPHSDVESGLYSGLTFLLNLPSAKHTELMTRAIISRQGTVCDSFPVDHVIVPKERITEANRGEVRCVDWLAQCNALNQIVPYDHAEWCAKPAEQRLVEPASRREGGGDPGADPSGRVGEMGDRSGEGEQMGADESGEGVNQGPPTPPSPPARPRLPTLSSQHVTLPCDPGNQYYPTDSPTPRPAWERITATLRPATHPTFAFDSAAELRAMVRKYNRNLRGQFTTLDRVLTSMGDGERQEALQQTLPYIATLALEAEILFPSGSPLPFLGPLADESSDSDGETPPDAAPASRADVNRSTIWLTRHQVGCLLANGFLCTFPHRNSDDAMRQIPSFNFASLHTRSSPESQPAKLLAFLRYFDRLRRIDSQSQAWDSEYVGYTVQTLSRGHAWARDASALGSVELNGDSTIEETVGTVHADFANRKIGGGVIGGGCVQEEIRFVIAPETVVSRLFTRFLCDRTAVIISGAQQFVSYTGYAAEFRCGADFIDPRPRSKSWDGHLIVQSHITCFDALCFRTCLEYLPDDPLTPSPRDITPLLVQYAPSVLLRELNKALVAFDVPQCATAPIATGHWGCGVFGGDQQLKFVVQWMACGAAGCAMHFSTFGHEDFRKQAQQLLDVAEDWGGLTVARLFMLLREYREYLEGFRDAGDSQATDYGEGEGEGEGGVGPTVPQGLFRFLMGKLVQ